MKCPECKEKIPFGAGVCPVCGYPLKEHKKVSHSRILVIPLVALFILLLVGGLNYSDTRPTVEAINAIGIVTLESEDAIHSAQEKYDHLNLLQRLFVTNYKVLQKATDDFNALPIELTPENVRQYFDFNVIFKDFNDQDLSVYSLALFYHSASANMEVNCIPKKDKYYEDVRIVLDYDLGSVYTWISPAVEISVGTDGKGSRTEKITYGGMLRPSLPNSNCKFVIKKASGNIYNAKPE